MFDDHYTPLVASYAVALLGWLLVAPRFKNTWPAARPARFERPWREFGIALLGVAGVIGMGQLWSQGIRLPEDGAAGPFLAAANQALIFLPILAVVPLRRQSWSSAWLTRGHLATRLLVGLGLATLAVTTYSLLRADTAPPWTYVGRIWRVEHFDELAQVFFEDVAIAIVFVRLAAAVGARPATALVAVLFAAGHIPAMLSGGATASDLTALLRDAGLGVAVIFVLRRSRDVLWFWLVHFCMDMTQFERVRDLG